MVDDPREVPTYGLAEAAHYLHVPQNTLGNWVRGHQKFRKVLNVPKSGRLSFINLVEAHMLAAIRRKHNISLQNIRTAVDYLQREFNQTHPLATMPLEADEVDLFVRHLGRLINASKHGQVGMKEAIEAHLRRVDRGPDNKPLALYPFVGGDYSIDRKPVMFDPRIAFGRLVIVGSGISTSEVAHRFSAGETISALAEDYGRTALEIEDAIRSEFPLAVAA